MQSRLTKTLYLGLAALSLGAVTTLSTTASAKSYAKVTSTKTLKTAGDTRNVVSTGTNAIYSKPGTVKGAKVVASKKTMKKLATSKKSADYFRAYAVATTNKGSVYYKVVTMNGKYRGYIYGGKSTSAFSGGIKTANTMTDATMPTTTKVYFAKPGKANVTWNAPKYTQYKASKQVKDTTPFAKDTLTITKAATKTREGSLYYYVEDAANPSINGWIYSGAVSSAQSAEVQAQNGITLKFVNKATGASVADKVVAMPTTAKNDTVENADLVKLAKDTTNLPAGYTYDSLGTANSVAKGGSVVVYVNQNAEADLTLTPTVYNNDVDAAAQTALSVYWNDTAKAVLAKDTFFKQVGGTTATAANIEAQLKTDKLDTIVAKTTTKNADGTYVAYQYTLKSADQGTYGSSSKVYYTAVKGSVASTTTDGDFTAAK